MREELKKFQEPVLDGGRKRGAAQNKKTKRKQKKGVGSVREEAGGVFIRRQKANNLDLPKAIILLIGTFPPLPPMHTHLSFLRRRDLPEKEIL